MKSEDEASDKIQEILKTRPEEREGDGTYSTIKIIPFNILLDVNFLFEWVMENESMQRIFKGVQDIICKTICREMTLIKMDQDAIVCREGEYGDTFFIIVSGEVALYIQTEVVAPKQNEARKASVFSKAEQTIFPMECRKELFGKHIKNLGSGTTFGELAVMDPDAKRSCSILTDVSTSFICIKRGAYQRLTRANTKTLTGSLVDFVKDLYLFTGWPRPELARLCNKLRKEDFKTGTYLTRHGEDCHGLFILLSGKVEEIVPIITYCKTDGENPRHFPVEDALSSSKAQDSLKKTHLRRNYGIHVNSYTSHDVCGEHPLISNSTFYDSNLKACSDVEVLVLDPHAWNEMFVEDKQMLMQTSKRKLMKLAKARAEWLQTRMRVTMHHPTNVLTLSCDQMRKHGHLPCGWCGHTNHFTGEPSCPKHILYLENKSQEDEIGKQREEKKEYKRMLEEYERLKLQRQYDPVAQKTWKDRQARIARRVMTVTAFMNLEKVTTTSLLVEKEVRKNQKLSLKVDERRRSSPLTIPICTHPDPETTASSKNDPDYYSILSKPPPVGHFRKEMMKKMKKIVMPNMKKIHDIKNTVLESSLHQPVRPKNPRVPRTSTRHPDRLACRRKRMDKRHAKRITKLWRDEKLEDEMESMKEWGTGTVDVIVSSSEIMSVVDQAYKKDIAQQKQQKEMKQKYAGLALHPHYHH